MKLTTLVLTQADVARLVDLRMAIRAVRQAFRETARHRAHMPPKVYLPLPHQSDFRAMPAYLPRPGARQGACGIKWVNVHPGNRRRGLPTVMAVIVMNDPRTGVPLAVMDGLLITKLRTAAAGAVAAQVLARRESRVIGLVGCGAQADAQVLGLAQVLRFTRVAVWGHRPGEAAQFCRRMRRHMPRVEFAACRTVEACVRQADVLVTLTPSRRALVRRAWLRPGTHINAIGADAPGKQELEPRILREALVVVDERTQAVHGGELNVAIRRGVFHPQQIHASLGEILLGRKRGRRGATELTVFDSTGLAVHDIAVGFEVVRQALRRGIGRRVALCSDRAGRIS